MSPVVGAATFSTPLYALIDGEYVEMGTLEAEIDVSFKVGGTD